MSSVHVTFRVTGTHVAVINREAFSVFPEGEIERGELVWHAAPKKWIIRYTEEGNYLPEVGGCSAGPTVLDIQARIYWTC